MEQIDTFHRNMAAIDISKIDLNLLVVLDALLSEQSVTTAARRLGLTQSTLSHALGRLRELFGDPLLVRAGRGMVATARAEALAPALRRTLADVRRLLEHEERFAPGSSTRTFRIVCPDLLAAILPELLGRMAREAPRVQLTVLPPGETDIQAALALGSIDLAIGLAATEGPGLVQQLLGTVHWCVLARRGHPAVRGGRLTLSRWLSYPHITVGTGGGATGAVAQALEQAGLQRRIGFTAPSFLLAQMAVSHTDCFFAAPRELLRRQSAQLDLVMLAPPIALPPLRVAQKWHERAHHEPGHRWLRELLRDVLRAMLSPIPGR